MFNFSGSEIVFLLLLALIILGPEKLPDAIRSFGKTYSEFKKMTTGFQSELKNALDEPMREMRETADAFKQAASFDIAADMLEGKKPAATPDTAPTNGAEPPVAPAPPESAPAAPAAAAPAGGPTEGRRDHDLPSFDSVVMGRDHTYRPPEPQQPDADDGEAEAEAR